MTGIDYTLANIDARQRFSFTPSQLEALYADLSAERGVEGCVVISTCNRTELYLSRADGFDQPPFSALCGAMGVDPDDYAGMYFEKYGDEAVNHLCLLACGAKSQIFGEDQIISQVKNALALARKFHAADPVLEVLFRTAVTCGKRIKTELRLTDRETSIGTRLADRLAEYPDAKRVLVIGNGEIGRLCADVLTRRGYEVTMTVRRYRHAEVEVPDSVETAEYALRYELLGRFDAIASATRSPHYTIERAELERLTVRPALYFDLAVPRDIEKSVGSLPGVRLFDVDDLGDAHTDVRERQLADVADFVDKHKNDFYKWYDYRTSNEPRRSHFPLFLDIEGQKALVVGGGKIATRRVTTLRRFGFAITVVAKSATDEIKKLAKKGTIDFCERAYTDADIDRALLVVAATNDRALNHAIGKRAKALGRFVSVADCAEECNFYFPAVIERGKITVAVSGDGSDHRAVAQTAKQIREFLDDED